MKTMKDILAVVVLYEQVIGKSTTLISLNKCDIPLDVILYDNSPNAQTLPQPEVFPNLRLTYIHNPQNPGVSKAYNTAAQFGLDRRKKYLLLLDQDTILPSNAMATYLEALNQYEGINLFAPFLKFSDKIYSPCNYYLHRGSHKRDFQIGLNSLKNTNFLNSGLLVNLNALLSIGGYDEYIRLYFSDFEFINRFKKHNTEYVLINIYCEHELASTERTDVNKALKRFQYYCSDAKAASKNLILWLQYFITVGLRSLKLSMHFRNLKFGRIFLADFI